MAIAKLFPTATSDPSTVIAAGDHTNIDETSDVGGGAGDDSYCDTNVNEQLATFSFTMSDLPADADTINSATLRVRANISNAPGSNRDTMVWTVSCTNDGAAVTFDDTNEQTEGSKTASLTAETVTTLNAETITVEQTSWSQNKGPDGMFLRIEFIEIEVDYTPLAVPFLPYYGQEMDPKLRM